MMWKWIFSGVLVAVAFGIGAILGGMIFPPPLPPPRISTSNAMAWSNPLQPAYIGSEACAGCHADQAAAHASSGHSQTMTVADLGDRFPLFGEVSAADPERENRLNYEIQGKELVAVYQDKARSLRMPIQFALGSGVHATTFVNLVEGEQGQPTVLEHRFSLFNHGKNLGLTPSHAGLEIRELIEGFGRIHQGKDATTCLACHSTTGTIRGRDVDDLRPNVRCESCHGPGRDHAAARAANREDDSIRFGKRSAAPLEEIQMCGKCHRLPEMMSSPPSMNDPKLTRFQPVGLLNSNCYRRSAERLRCSTCHDPHQAVDHVPDHYNSLCRNCHSVTADNQKICPKSPLEKCVDCHMPSVEVHPGISFHDHWIRVRSSGEELKEERN